MYRWWTPHALPPSFVSRAKHSTRRPGVATHAAPKRTRSAPQAAARVAETMTATEAQGKLSAEGSKTLSTACDSGTTDTKSSLTGPALADAKRRSQVPRQSTPEASAPSSASTASTLSPWRTPTRTAAPNGSRHVVDRRVRGTRPRETWSWKSSAHPETTRWNAPPPRRTPSPTPSRASRRRTASSTDSPHGPWGSQASQTRWTRSRAGMK